MADFGNKFDICGAKKLRKSNFSPEEVEALVDTVSKNYHILYGEFAKRAVNKQARHKVWLDVTRRVNQVSIEKRTLQEVKNKWKKCQHMYREDSQEEFDSMPLEQRLKSPSDQEPVLQSQPLSPTKLKVTRQSTKPPQLSPKPVTPEPVNEEVCLRWNSHHSNMQSAFPNLLSREQYVDATLVAEGQSLKCHRLILSSCSPYFEEVLSGISPFQHPVLFMRDIPYWVLRSLCDFMYAGEVHIFQNRLEELLAVAESLKIKGLAGKLDASNEDLKNAETPKEEKKDEVREKERRRSFQPYDSTPKTSSKTVKPAQPSKKNEKVVKEPISKDNILDPLDLLEPVYEEVTSETSPPKLREVKSVPVKKGRFKKRKISEEREESPPPLLLSRKGTRSRPNVKIPKYYHTHYERVPESTIIREPHTNQPDPLMQVEEIKAEPIDLDDDVIEIEDNIIGFTDVSEVQLNEEEIVGDYNSPIVNVEKESTFKKINLVPQPIIMNVHSVEEKIPNTLKIVDVAKLKETIDTQEIAEDPLNISETVEKGTESITITNVQSIAEIDEVEVVDCDKVVQSDTNCGFLIEKIESEAHSLETVPPEVETNTVVEKDQAQDVIEITDTENVINNVSCNEISVKENVQRAGAPSEEIIEIDPEKEENEAENAGIKSVSAVTDQIEENQEIEASKMEKGEEIPNDTEPDSQSEKEAVEDQTNEENKDDISENRAGEISLQKPVVEDQVNEEKGDVGKNCAQELDSEKTVIENQVNEENRDAVGENYAVELDLQKADVEEQINEENNDILNENCGREPECQKMDVEEQTNEANKDVANEMGVQDLDFQKMDVEEQINEENREVVGENSTEDLGFEIMDVVSEKPGELNEKVAPESVGGVEVGTCSNHLDEGGESVEKSESLSEETLCLAESLEKLLDE